MWEMLNDCQAEFERNLPSACSNDIHRLYTGTVVASLQAASRQTLVFESQKHSVWSRVPRVRCCLVGGNECIACGGFGNSESWFSSSRLEWRINSHGNNK